MDSDFKLFPPNFQERFFLDNLQDGVKNNELIAWPAFDTVEKRDVCLVGRKVNDKVFILAVLLLDSVEAIKRYIY